MKRASLSITPPAQKTEALDLTDRLLDRESSAKPARAKTAAARPKAKPAPKASTPKRPRAPKSSSSVPSVQSVASVDTSVDPVDTVDQALAQSSEALAALTAAAHEAPARYHLALRYRLDALAHHLRQVAEFVESTSHQRS